MMFALGFWKKLVYIMNVRLSLDLCYKFTDAFNFEKLLDRLPQKGDPHYSQILTKQYESMLVMIHLK